MVKLTSFYRDWITYTAKVFSFSVFHLFPVKEKQENKKKTLNFENKISNFFLKFIFQKFYKLEILRSEHSLCKWNKTINICLSVKLQTKMHFPQGPPKTHIFYANRFFVCFREKRFAYVWDFMIHIVCLEGFPLRWIINLFFFIGISH